MLKFQKNVRNGGDNLKKYFICCLVLLLIFSNIAFADELSDAAKYLQQQELDQWGILALYAHGENIESKVLEEPDSKALTDYERYLMGAISLEKNILNVVKKVVNCQRSDGKFSDFIDGTGSDLVNAHVWGVISLYAANYEVYDKAKALEWLKKNQNEDGGFPIYSGKAQSDLDMTAMAIVAYKILGLDENSAEIQDALTYLQNNMSQRESSEAYAWYILAHIHLGLNIDESLYKEFLAYQSQDGGFMHLTSINKSNYMATWHGLLAITSYKDKLSIFEKLHHLNRFVDLGKKDHGYEKIMYLVNQGVISGYSDQTFRAHAFVKRGEFCKFLIYGLNLQNQINQKTNKFNDLGEDHWANEIVKVAVDKGFIKGVTNNQFAPESKIKGSEVAALLVRANGLESKAMATGGSNWHDGYVEIANHSNLLYSNFKPESYATREQCAEAIYRLIRN